MRVIRNAMWATFVAGVIAGLLTACNPTTTEQEVAWHDPSFSGGPFKKILVLGISNDLLKKKAFEDIFSDMLRRRGTEAVPSYTVMPQNAVLGKEAIKKAIEGQNVDGVFILQAVGRDTTTETIPGYTVNESNYQNRYNFYNYYTTTSRNYSVPDRTVEIENVYLDTKVFDVATEKLVWQQQTKLVNPKDFVDSVRKVGKSLIKGMAGDNVVK